MNTSTRADNPLSNEWTGSSAEDAESARGGQLSHEPQDGVQGVVMR